MKKIIRIENYKWSNNKDISEDNNKEDMCYICNRCYDELWNIYAESYLNEGKDAPEVNVKLLSYELSHPICHICYFNIMVWTEFIQEILESNPDDVWATDIHD